MERKQKEQIIIVITVVALVLMFIGISYAYFTSVNNERSGSSIVAAGGKMLINYDDGTDDIKPVTNIKPSNAILVDKTFTLTGTNTTKDLTMPYKVGLKYTSTFSGGMMHYYIKEVNRPANSNVTTNYVIKPAEGKTEDDYKNQTVPGNASKTGYVHGTLKNGTDVYTEMVTGEFPASTDDQTITFNLILQFPDNNENQDSEKGATINGKVVVNYEVKPTTFAEDSWETIATVVKRGQLDAYSVGSVKNVEIDGTTSYVRVANNTIPEECNGDDFSESACGFVVEFVRIIEFRGMNSTKTNKGGWPASELRTYLNGDFYNKLPEDLRNVIIDTKVISGHGSTEGETNFTSTDKIYLLSGHEVWEDGTSNQVSTYDTAYNNTRQLDYYKKSGVTTNKYSYAQKLDNNLTTHSWWLRTASSNTNYSFEDVYYNGSSAYNSEARGLMGLAPAFRIG